MLLQRIEKPEKVSVARADIAQNVFPVSSGDQRPPALRGETEQQRVAEEPGELAEQRRRILAVLPERFKLRERFLGISGENGVRNGLCAERSGQSHGVAHRRGVYRFRRGALVEQRKAVAHAAVGKAAQKLRRVRREIDALLLRNIGETLGDRVAVEPPEAVALAAGEDRGKNFMELRCCENEHEMLRRLLQNFQQSVERRFGEHVHLVDDVHALANRGRREDRLVAQHAHIVHAVVGRRIQLDHVENGAVLNAAAGVALVAGVSVHRVLAVDRLGENARAGRFARAAGADKKIGVAKPSGTHLGFERFGDERLPHHIVKGFRPVFPVQSFVQNPSLRFWENRKRSLARLHTFP